MSMNDRLRGWDEIAGYLRIDRRTAQKYENLRGLPVHRLQGGGPKSPVHAFKSELDKWQPPSGARAASDEGFTDQVLRRISSLSLAKSLYRKDFLLRFRLEQSGSAVLGRVEIEYELVNGGSEKQPYIQEITIDDCERGHVEIMSVSVGGKPIFCLNRPAITESHRGYVSYQGPRIMIEPSAIGRLYKGRASWVIKRNNTDFWYLHAGIPTFGAKVETVAPPNYDITPNFSVADLLLKSEHIDITWKKRGPE